MAYLWARIIAQNLRYITSIKLKDGIIILYLFVFEYKLRESFIQF